MGFLKKKKTKIGLALGCGSARGLAHIGVLKVLEREKIPIDLIAGTSMGSLIGALYAAGMKAKALEEIALNMDWRQIAILFTPTISLAGLVDGKRIETLIESFIGEKKFSQLKIPLATVATDIETGEEVIITQGSVLKAIRASISVPGIFTPLKYGDKLLIDGGVVNPVPVEVASQLGGEVIIAVNVLPEFGLRKRPTPKVKTKTSALKASGTFNKINANIINKRISEFVKTKVKSIEVVNRIANIFQEKIKVEKVRGPNVFNILLQTISIMEYEIVKLRLKSADIIIKPEVSHIKPVQFYRAKECILEGERKTEEVLPKIKRRIK